jgi:DNA-binding phage protein
MPELLDSALKGGDLAEPPIALRQMGKAFDGLRSVAKKGELNPNQLYRTLPAEGNPEIKSLAAILPVMGLRLAVRPIAKLPD